MALEGTGAANKGFLLRVNLGLEENTRLNMEQRQETNLKFAVTRRLERVNLHFFPQSLAFCRKQMIYRIARGILRFGFGSIYFPSGEKMKIVNLSTRLE